jgi:hypothetical protein
MKPIRADFARRFRGPPFAAWVVVLALAVTVAALYVDARRMREVRLTAEADEMQRQKDASQRSLTARPERSSAQVRLDELGSLRFVPWPAALRALESVPRGAIELESVRVDSRSRLVELEGRAPDGGAVVAYVQDLNAGVPAEPRAGRWDLRSVESREASGQRHMFFVIGLELVQ